MTVARSGNNNNGSNESPDLVIIVTVVMTVARSGNNNNGSNDSRQIR